MCSVYNTNIMRKIIFIAIILSSMFPSKAQIKVTQGFGLEAYHGHRYKINCISFDKGEFAAKHKLSVAYKIVSINALTSVYMNYVDRAVFAPIHCEFDINIALDFKKIRIEVAHQCVHPIQSSATKNWLKGGFDRIGIYYNW